MDTSIVSEIRKGAGADRGVSRWFAGVGEDELCISVLVAGEVRQGVERLRARDPERTAFVERWLGDLRRHYGERILEVEVEDAELWGRINVPTHLPAVDGLMAAQARRRGMTIVSADTGDFERTGVELLNPFEGGGQG